MTMSLEEFRGTPLPKGCRSRVEDRECVPEKLRPEQIDQIVQCLPDQDDILGCFECSFIVEQPNSSFFNRVTATSFHTVLVTTSCLISTIYGDEGLIDWDDEEDIRLRTTPLANIVSIEEYQDSAATGYHHIHIQSQGDREDYFTFWSPKNAKKFIAILNRAVAEAKGESLPLGRDEGNAVAQQPHFVEKTFQWEWMEKRQRGTVYALFDETSLRLTLYTKPGLGMATGRGWLPSDIHSIAYNIISTFTVEGVPASEYVLQKLDVEKFRYELEVKHDSDGLGANLAVLKFDSMGMIQSTTPFRICLNYERLSTPTNTREPGPRLESWVMLCLFITQFKDKYNSITSKLPLGRVHIREI